jgi:hypothetical protein
MQGLEPNRIKDTLVYLQGTRPHVFGTDFHGFRLNPALSEADIVAFERTHHVAIPGDFREFLTQIGNGGAGPFYGIFPLGKGDDNFSLRVWEQGDVGVLSEPFPFEEEWNDLSTLPAGDLVDRDESEYWKQMDESTYWGTSVVNGAFPICHQGCALRILLVVTGPQAGYLWDDRRSEYGGLKPLRLADGSSATFMRWYNEWLKNCLETSNSRE